jgi:Antitoxin Phd_YefM, type II toxin-antitoxin system
MTWRATQAKAQFSEVLDRAESEGLQVVERRKRRFVLMTEEELALRTHATAEESTALGKTSGKRLWDALRCPPEDGIDVEFPRLEWNPREVEL